MDYETDNLLPNLGATLAEKKYNPEYKWPGERTEPFKNSLRTIANIY